MKLEKVFKILVYIIPLSILFSILYLNFLPFGYIDKVEIDVGEENDTKGRFYLEEINTLGDREIDKKGTFRFVNNLAYATYKTKAIIKDARVKISLEGEDIYFVQQPSIDFNWDYNWQKKDFLTDFEIVSSIENGQNLEKDRCFDFDGRTRLILLDSAQKFEEGPFAIYVEWEPQKREDRQQIIGHFNWEIYQNSDSITFVVGRMTESDDVYSIEYSVDESFFNREHSLLAIYNTSSEDGYIELFVDEVFTGRTYFGNQEIRTDYGGENLSLGWTTHDYGEFPYFEGMICNARFGKTAIEMNKSLDFTTTIKREMKIPISGHGNLYNIMLEIEK